MTVHIAKELACESHRQCGQTTSWTHPSIKCWGSKTLTQFENVQFTMITWRCYQYGIMECWPTLLYHTGQTNNTSMSNTTGYRDKQNKQCLLRTREHLVTVRHWTGISNMNSLTPCLSRLYVSPLKLAYDIEHTCVTALLSMEGGEWVECESDTLI